MGTNFYAKIIPTKERKESLKKLIDDNNFHDIREQVIQMYDSFKPLNMEDEIQGEIHLGKRSAGWRFLWNPNIYMIRQGHTEWTEHEGGRSGHWIQEPSIAYYVYPLTRKGIKAFIDREDIEIYDEYGDKQDKEGFWKEALGWTAWNGHEAWDADSYDKEYPNEKHFSWENEYTDFLESLGYKLSKYKSDFYSDGLRFSTTTDFG